MQQMVFNLFPPAPATFDNFIAGHNTEIVAALRQFLDAHSAKIFNPANTTSFYLWGAHGTGKTHLIHAAADNARMRHFPFINVKADNPFPDIDQPPSLWLIDDVDIFDDNAQAKLFTLYNHLREAGGALLVSASLPPAQLSFRDDIRTRLGWGFIYEVLMLDDEQKIKALKDYACTKGLKLSDDIVAYILKMTRRNMRSLTTLIDALDGYSLSLKRPLTLPLVRAWLQRQNNNPAT